MAVAVKEEYQRALDEQQKEVRNLVMEGLEQINLLRVCGIFDIIEEIYG